MALHPKSLTLHKSILHLPDTSLSILSHSQNIKGKNSSIIERQKNDEAIFCHFLDSFFFNFIGVRTQ
jgi:hypothetical protein